MTQTGLGLSPRVRGNRHDPIEMNDILGLSPRVRLPEAVFTTGLSPRVRGNLGSLT